MFKQCPKCNIYVEKTGGCKWIKCKCKVKWCWNCIKIKKNKSKYTENDDTICMCKD